MLGKFNPAVLMAAIMGQLAQVSTVGKSRDAGYLGPSRQGRGRYPTRKMIEKARNKKKFKLGRTR